MRQSTQRRRRSTCPSPPDRPTSDHSFEFSSAANVGEAISSLLPAQTASPSSVFLYPLSFSLMVKIQIEGWIEKSILPSRPAQSAWRCKWHNLSGGRGRTESPSRRGAISQSGQEMGERRSDRPAGNEGLVLLIRGIGPLFLFLPNCR